MFTDKMLKHFKQSKKDLSLVNFTHVGMVVVRMNNKWSVIVLWFNHVFKLHSHIWASEFHKLSLICLCMQIYVPPFGEQEQNQPCLIA